MEKFLLLPLTLAWGGKNPYRGLPSYEEIILGSPLPVRAMAGS
jgi:hypothetical protein